MELDTIRRVFRPLARRYLKTQEGLSKHEWLKESGFAKKRRSFYKYANSAIKSGYVRDVSRSTDTVEIGSLTALQAIDHATKVGWKIIGPLKPTRKINWSRIALPQRWDVYDRS